MVASALLRRHSRGISAPSFAAIVGAATLGATTLTIALPATAPATALENYIEVTSTCSLSEAIVIANAGALNGPGNPSGGATDDCPNHFPGTTTIRITANSGTAIIPGTTVSVPGVQLDPIGPATEIFGGAMAMTPTITGPLTIEGDPNVAGLGIYALPAPPRPSTCHFVIIAPGVGDNVCTVDTAQPNGKRIFSVDPFGSLTLRNLNIAGGEIEGGRGFPTPHALGGAIYSAGPLTLENVTLFGNSATGGDGANAAGGAVYSGSTLTVAHSVFERNSVHGGDLSGSALGGAIALAPTSSATISDTIFIESVAEGGNGYVGEDGVEGRDGTDGTDGVCDPKATYNAAGDNGENGDHGGDGGPGGDGGDAVGVLFGGNSVKIDHSSFVGSVAIAGAAGAGGFGGQGGDGGDGGDGISCTVNVLTAVGSVWDGASGHGGQGGANGLNDVAGDRGTAVATIDVDDALELSNVTMLGGSASVPMDNFGTRTAAEWEDARDQTTQLTGGGGSGGTGGSANGGPGFWGALDETFLERQALVGAGIAVAFEPDDLDRVAVSFSTIADMSFSVPTENVYRTNSTTAELTLARPIAAGFDFYGFRSSVVWNRAAPTAGCPNMRSGGYNVFGSPSPCTFSETGDVTVTRRPISLIRIDVGSEIRPAYQLGAAFRMPMLTLRSNSPAVDRTAAGECLALGELSLVVDDGRRLVRDAFCDSGAFEYRDGLVPELSIDGATTMYRDSDEPNVVSVGLPFSTGGATSLVVTVNGMDDVAFPAGFQLTANDALPMTSEAQITPPSEGYPHVFDVPLFPDSSTADDVTVLARIDGAVVGTINATPLPIEVFFDGRVNLTIHAPPAWSPCSGYMPITYVASNPGHSRMPAANVLVWPFIVKPTLANKLHVPPPKETTRTTDTPLVYATGGSTAVVDLDGQVIWQVPSLGPGDPAPTLTIYVALGRIDPTQSWYTPGLTVRASSVITFAPPVPTGVSNPTIVKPKWIPVGNDLDLLAGDLAETAGVQGADAHVKAGTPSTLFASIDPDTESCHDPADKPHDWGPLGLTVRDPESATPDTPILGPVGTMNLVDPQSGSGWFPVQFTAPTTPGRHFLDFEFAGLGSEPIRTLVPYTVDPVGVEILDSANAAESPLRSFEVQLDHTYPDPVTVQWKTVDGTATAAGNDFLASDGVVTIPAGETSGEVNVTVNDDSDFEPDEVFFVAIEESAQNPLPAGVEIAASFGIAGLINDDYALSVDDVSITEGDSGQTDLRFTISSPLRPPSPCSVRVRTALDGTAGAADVDPLDLELTISNIGHASRAVDVAILADVIDEPDETFTLELSPGSSGTPCTLLDAAGTGTIIDDDTTKISVADVTVTEGTGSGSTEAAVTVELSTPSAADVNVQLATTVGTATAADFTATSDIVTIPAGSTTGTFTVDVNRDAIDEGDEAFTVGVTDAGGVQVADGTATVTITDDDIATITIDDVTVTEGTGAGTTQATFTVRLATTADHGVSVEAYTIAGTAGAGDYSNFSAEVAVAAGNTSATFTVDIARDAAIELDETFTIKLVNADNAPIGDDTAVATIVNDDFPTVSAGDVTVPEGSGGTTVTVPIILSEPSPAPITVTVVIDGCAAAGDGVEATVTIPAGVTSFEVGVPIEGNATPQDDQTCTVTLIGGVGAEVDSSPGSVTVVDDDAFVLSGDTTVKVSEGARAASVTMTLNAPAPAGGIAFDFATVDGTATAPQDYASKSGVATIAAGTTSVAIDFVIVDDGNHEPDESFSVVISNVRLASPESSANAAEAHPLSIEATNLAVGNAGTVTIADDDPASAAPGDVDPTSPGPPVGKLPLTGSDLATLIAIALAVLATGVLIRRRARPHGTAVTTEAE